MIRARYFSSRRLCPEGSPAPLALSLPLRPRFSEIDPLGVVWHGHYAAYFEEARVAFGEQYGLSYQTMYDAGVVAPIRKFRIDYEAPLRFGQDFRVSAALFWNEAARLDFEYEIRDARGALLTRGCTVQLFLTLAGELCFAKPEVYEEFCLRWKRGELRKDGENA